MTNYIVDSSVWVSYFEENAACKSIIEDNNLQTPSIVVAEVVKILKQRRVPNAILEKSLDFIHSRSIILPLDFNEAANGGKVVAEEKLDFVDGIVYSYASEENKLVTTDNDFNGKPFAKLVER